MEWYKGDGTYGDGPPFHWDYYNGFEIHPMLLDIVETMSLVAAQEMGSLPRAGAGRGPALRGDSGADDFSRRNISRDRAVAGISLRPPSICWPKDGFAGKDLPPALSPGQVKSALSAVLRRMIEAPGTFDAQGFLSIGFCGHQPAVGEEYISTGSLYLCTAGLLPLGLPPSDEFWASAPADWTAKRVWSGQDIAADRAIDG